MIKKLCILVLIPLLAVSCQFTETMVLNEDGSGRVSVSIDMAEMMAFSGEFSKDSTMVKLDTIVRMRDVLIEKRDSISKLPKEEQDRLKRLENFNFKTLMDPEKKELIFDVYTEFKSVSEANELMNAFENSANFLQGASDGSTKIKTDKASAGTMAVSFNFDDNIFTRDAYILDPLRHSTQVDSIKQAEAFMSSMTYKIKYTFPKKIIKSSVEDARYSLDGKTIEFERSFIEYFKNPDVTDLEVELAH